MPSCVYMHIYTYIYMVSPCRLALHIYQRIHILHIKHIYICICISYTYTHTHIHICICICMAATVGGMPQVHHAWCVRWCTTQCTAQGAGRGALESTGWPSRAHVARAAPPPRRPPRWALMTTGRTTRSRRRPRRAWPRRTPAGSPRSP